MSENKFTFAFFPYLKTTEPVRYRGITIRSSDDLTALPTDAIPHLEKLRRMFFLKDHFRIKQMSYAFCNSVDKASVSKFTEELFEFQTFICYFYSSPHPTSGDPFLRSEHSSLYLFQPKEIFEGLISDEHNVEVLPEAQNIKVNARKEVDGYEGVLNNKSYLWVTDGSRIFPPTVSLWLNISQDLGVEFNHQLADSDTYRPVVEYFAAKNDAGFFRKRILTALSWYNKSIRIDIDESEALINLAIAFESLLDLDRGDSLTTRFKEAVGLLAGDIGRLDSWLTQFYNARSDIVHKGQSRHLMFISTDDPKKDIGKPELEYRSLVSYGRQIFRVCAATVLTGAKLANKLNLPSLLISNQERFERIFQTLGEKDKTPVERILSTSQDVNDIENYRFVPEKGLKIDRLIGTAKLMAKQILETNPDYDSELIGQMQSLVSTDTKNHYEALSFINILQEKAQAKNISEPAKSNLHHLMTTLLKSIWGYTFIYFYQLQNKKLQDANDVLAAK